MAVDSPQHATLVANTVTTLTFAAREDHVEVLNVDGAAAVYFTVDGSTPSIGGTGSHVLPAAIGSFDVAVPSIVTTVKLISSGTPKVSARVW